MLQSELQTRLNLTQGNTTKQKRKTQRNQWPVDMLGGLVSFCQSPVQVPEHVNVLLSRR